MPTARTLPNGIATTASYDGISRLTQLKHSLGGGTVNDFQYAYNSASDITQITEPTRTRGFDYDLADRLTSVTTSAGSNESYTYDSVGNRTSSHLSASYGLQPFNKIVSTATASYTYDGNGNMTSRWDAAGRWYFTWDAENRLVRVVKPGWRPLSYRTITYSYDALGRRFERQSKATGTESYTYDGQDVILDQNSSGAQTTYINGPGIDNKLKQTSNGTSSYFLQDRIGSVTAITDASGTVTSSATYDGYGRQTGPLDTRYSYTGRELDSEIGLLFYRARWYDPTLGRFIGEDPIGFAGGTPNLYEYVHNNPLLFNDPSGLMTHAQECFLKGAPIGMAIGAFVGGLAGGGVGLIGIVGGPLVIATVGGGAVGGALMGAGVGLLIGGAIGGIACGGLDAPSLPPCSAPPAPMLPPIYPSYKKDREQLLEGNPPCVWCGLPSGRNGKPGQADHKLPKSKGGSDEPANLQPSCQWCNGSRGNRPAPKNKPPDYEGPWPRPGSPEL